MRRNSLMKLRKIKYVRDKKNSHSHVCVYRSRFSSHGGGDKATPVLHHILGQWQRRNGGPQSRLPNLLLHQGPAVVQTSAGQQHPRSGRHILRRAAEEKRFLIPTHAPGLSCRMHPLSPLGVTDSSCSAF